MRMRNRMRMNREVSFENENLFGETKNPDKRHFFTISRGSVFECVAILEILYCEKKIEEEIYLEQLNAADQISRMLYAMIKNLSN